jgi:prepilin-type processing-associated H-X9-DG protein
MPSIMGSYFIFHSIKPKRQAMLFCAKKKERDCIGKKGGVVAKLDFGLVGLGSLDGGLYTEWHYSKKVTNVLCLSIFVTIPNHPFYRVVRMKVTQGRNFMWADGHMPIHLVH